LPADSARRREISVPNDLLIRGVPTLVPRVMVKTRCCLVHVARAFGHVRMRQGQIRAATRLGSSPSSNLRRGKDQLLIRS
jgi:hypothetical protein